MKHPAPSKLRILALVFASGVACMAHADEARCPTIPGGSEVLAEQPPAARLRFVQRRLDDDAQRVRIWAWTWAAMYTGLTVGNAARLATSSNHDDRVDSAVATGASAFGLLVLAIMPPAVLRDQPKLSRIVSRFREATDRCAVLADAERILLRDAKSESFGRGPLVHAGNFVFNMAIGLLLGTVFHRWQTAAVVTPVGILAGELQQLTIRTHTKDTLDHYRAGDLSYRAPRPGPSFSIAPQLGKDEVGVGFGMSF